MDKTKLCEKLVVKNVINETSDAVSLVFDIPEQLKNKFKYRAGQFVTLFLEIDGEEVRRSYSIPSAPEIDTDFKITVKLVPGGKGSTFICQKVKTGDSLWVTPPAGLFCLPKDLTQCDLAFYAAGSGVTPIISLIKEALKKWSGSRCVLLYQNKNESSVLFNEELRELVKKMSPRLTVEHYFSSPQSSSSDRTGRVDPKMVREFIIRNKLNIRTRHFLCGPEGFMQNVKIALIDLGYDRSQIFFESFQTPQQAGGAQTHTHSSTQESDSILPEDAIAIGDMNDKSEPSTIEAMIDGEKHSVPYKSGMSVLDCLLDAGLNPPYSCMDGACMACMAKVSNGLVYQMDMGILTDDNVEARECLTCQARPASKNVKINYDNL